MKIYSLLIIISILVSCTHVDAAVIDLELLHTDSTGESDESIDFVNIWMGTDSSKLYVIISFAQYSSSYNVNFTIENADGEAFLVIIEASNSTDELLITYATSVFDDSIPAGTSYFEQYFQDRVYYNPNAHEMGFFINLDSINVESWPIYVIGYSRNNSIVDKIPNTGVITFDGTVSADRNEDFDILVTEFISYTPTSYEFTETYTYSTIDPSSPELNPLVLPVLLLIVITAWIILRRNKKAVVPIEKLRAPKPLDSMTYDPEMRYVESLGRNIRLCCYQTARLQEQYCYCGRAVEKDVLDLFKE
ncbi:MAG: hypothetical protein INQ03_05785 [Candidatus Heimdallarchaeota archaeon]|nr:hypothetical protein [Candidatus Heimdallarchaeota archaeon]